MTKIIEVDDNQETVTLYVTGNGQGTVTSIAVTGSDEFTVTGSPITDSGTIDIALKKTETLSFLNVADGATANQTDAYLLARTNHTGTQTASTISDFDTEVSNNSDVTANTAKATFPEAPIDGNPYARKDAGWVSSVVSAELDVYRFESRVGIDGGRAENIDGLITEFPNIKNSSIAMLPSSFKATKLYNQKPTQPDPADFTVARASDVTRINEDGVLEVLGNDVPCIDYSDGFPVLLTQPQSTNLYLNNETLSTQNVTTSAIPYTVSFYGTGTITFTGTHTGSLVGTGVSDRVQVTFTPTAGTLTSTVSGTVTKGQIEALSYATTPIPTTGATATRLGDVISGAGSTDSINSEEGVLYVESAALANDLTQRMIIISDGTSNNYIRFSYFVSQNRVTVLGKVGGSVVASIDEIITDITQFQKFAVVYNSNKLELWVGESETAEVIANVSFPANTLNVINFYNEFTTNFFYGKTKDLRVYSSIAAAQIDLPYIT